MLPRGDFALIIASETQPSSLELARAQRHATPEAAAVTGKAGCAEPVGHARDIRSELLVKLALLDRAGADPKGVAAAQHERLAPVADGLGRPDKQHHRVRPRSSRCGGTNPSAPR